MTKSVAELCREQEVAFEELLERSGLDRSRVQAIVEGRWTPSPQERQRIAEALGVEVTFFFEGLSPKADNRSRKGNVLPHDVTEDREAAELIRAYYSIPEHQRRRLFELARVLSDVS